MLIDVSPTAAQVGLSVPVDVTPAVHALLIDVPRGGREDYAGRLSNMLDYCRLTGIFIGMTDNVLVFDARFKRRAAPPQIRRFQARLADGRLLIDLAAKS